MMYYVTRESFIRDAAQRYMQQAIDWQTGECSFDNAEFIALLETVGQITEHPETTEFTGYVPPEEELRTGKTYIETVRVANVAKLSEFEKAVGQELSFVGMPMPDGSNGSVMDPSSPVGVFAGSEKPDGCREFVKYLLLSYDMSYHRDKNSALPMYRPYLEKLEAEAVSEGRMTAEEVERFESFLASVENSTLVDETALGIICEEAAACFTGARTGGGGRADNTGTAEHICFRTELRDGAAKAAPLFWACTGETVVLKFILNVQDPLELFDNGRIYVKNGEDKL